MTIFNRKELFVTFSMAEQARVRDILDANKIDYSIKVINRNSSAIAGGNRSRTGTFGQNMDMAYEYIIYVKKSDFDNATVALKP